MKNKPRHNSTHSSKGSHFLENGGDFQKYRGGYCRGAELFAYGGVIGRFFPATINKINLTLCKHI